MRPALRVVIEGKILPCPLCRHRLGQRSTRPAIDSGKILPVTPRKSTATTHEVAPRPSLKCMHRFTINPYVCTIYCHQPITLRLQRSLREAIRVPSPPVDAATDMPLLCGSRAMEARCGGSRPSSGGGLNFSVFLSRFIRVAL